MASPRSLCWTCHPDSGRAVRAVAAVATSTQLHSQPQGWAAARRWQLSPAAPAAPCVPVGPLLFARPSEHQGLFPALRSYSSHLSSLIFQAQLSVPSVMAKVSAGLWCLASMGEWRGRRAAHTVPVTLSPASHQHSRLKVLKHAFQKEDRKRKSRACKDKTHSSAEMCSFARVCMLDMLKNRALWALPLPIPRLHALG